MIKPNLILFIKLPDGSKGSGYGKTGAIAIVEKEKKTGKYIYYASNHEDYYEVVTDISYNQGGLGETMRGTSTIYVSINGMLDKGKRWVKKGKIDSYIHAIILDWRALRSGKVRGEIKYPTN